MTEEEMWNAELIHGPTETKSDTYRLHIAKDGDAEGKWLDVPGWMVGDVEMARERMLAAAIIRERLNNKDQQRLF